MPIDYMLSSVKIVHRLVQSSLLLSVCALICENGGLHVGGTCTCDCADGFIGTSCGSECIVCGMNLVYVGQVYFVDYLKVDTQSYTYERLKCTHNLLR